MYVLGRELPWRPLELNSESRISINYSESFFTPEMVKYLNDLVLEYPNTQYVAQHLNDLKTLYLGQSLKPGISSELSGYPFNIDHPFYKEDRVHFFTTPEAWIANMKQNDLSIGGRFHGNVAAVLSGTPSLTFPVDARMRELASYHELPQIPTHLLDPQMPLRALLERINLKSHLKNHGERFLHYLDFMKENSLETVFTGPTDRLTLICDEAKRQETGDITSFIKCTSTEFADRYARYLSVRDEKQTALIKGKDGQIKNKEQIIARQSGEIDERKSMSEKQRLLIEQQEKEISALREELDIKSDENSIQMKRIAQLEKINHKQEKQLNRRSVKLALKVANKCPKILTGLCMSHKQKN